MDQKLKVSVIMSVYNGDEYLSESIKSILNQTYTNLEFIIINDGSTDSSLSIINKFAKTDNRIKVVNQNNIGLTKSLNKGIHLSTGNFIARQDADDISLNNRFETQIPWLTNDGYDLCCSRAWMIDKNRITPRLSFWLPKKIIMYKYNPFIHGTFLFNKKYLLKINGYNEDFKYAQDYELMTRWYIAGFSVKYLSKCLYMLRNPSSSISVSKRSEQILFGNKVRKHWRNKTFI